MTEDLSFTTHSLSRTIALSRLLRWSILGSLFLIGFAIRLYWLNTPPLDFHPTRQYHSALIARSYYYEMQKDIPDWQRQVAALSAQREPSLEPPILETLSAFGYRIAGGEYLWIPRLLSIAFWLIGGVFLYSLALKMSSFVGSIVALAFYLLLPFGVQASTSFQPEPMMIMFVIIAVYLIVVYAESQSTQNLIMSAVFSALAILVKPNSLFFVYGAYISIMIYQKGDWRALLSKKSTVFFLISLLPALLFYGYGIFIAGYMRWKLQTSFVPQLLLQFDFWDGWLKRVRSVMGFTAVLGGVLGVLMFRNGWQKILLIGLWISYFVFVFAFTYHIHTHDYYHLPLILIVALSWCSGATLLFHHINSQSKERRWQFLLYSTLLVAVILSTGTSIQAKRKSPSFEGHIQTAIAIGELVKHSTQTLVLDEFDGKSLMYYGEFSGIYWPHGYDIRDAKLWNEPEMTAKERFDQLNIDNALHYFVITDLSELTTQPELNDFLRKNFAVLEENEDYLVFDLQSGPDS
jgi:4-amino-4-deoxy-L-arabinose transferase-like glycosyltransferase